MSGRFRGKDHNGETASLLQRLPFSNADVEGTLSSEPSTSIHNQPSSPRPARSQSISSHGLSSSYGQRVPTRSYYHHASHGHLEAPQYSSLGVREQTQELASWALGSSSARHRTSDPYHASSTSDSEVEGRPSLLSIYADSDEGRTSLDSARPDMIDEVIEELSEPVSPEENGLSQRSSDTAQGSGLTDLMRDTTARAKAKAGARRIRPSDDYYDDVASVRDSSVSADDIETGQVTENTRLLPRERLSGRTESSHYKNGGPSTKRPMQFKNRWARVRAESLDLFKIASHPQNWDVQRMGLDALGAIAAVSLGLLLNVLDALSYGMILFPLGETIFEKTGPDGISMFYVSCIVSQLVYSLGGSRFKGGVGSEMIEVVPFFHKMAYMIIARVGDDDPKAVMATVITSYALSSILTGIIFLLLGLFRLGDLVSFFPRSILLGCIGGVGVFLFLTGLEVSAGLDSNLTWDFDTLMRLVRPATLALWILPLALALLLMLIRNYLKHPVVMPMFFVIVTGIFYTIFAALPNVSLEDLQRGGWVFAAPEDGVPFYNFYSYYNFKLVNWKAISQVVPTMFALSFFGIIHVPINVPALGIAVKEDDVNINRELFGHGISNALSGLVGSVQNYLVFANSRLFIQNGGNSRPAGLLLALATIGVWVAGPAMIGYIPILVVGTLIFMLGIEMVQEALWDTFGKIGSLEYLMVLTITLVMGFHDFVVGIVLGIVLACLIFVVQTSRISAIRATYSGTIAESTVRRHPIQRRFLHAVGSQIKVAKLAGYLFFGTIVAVEKQTREMLVAESFDIQPIRYLILDFLYVSGLDFSAAEAFVRMNRILRGKGVEMVLSGISMESELGNSLIMVGLLEGGEGSEAPPPKIFYDLNHALEACENELLIAFKQRSEAIVQQKSGKVGSMNIPQLGPPSQPTSMGVDAMHSSPRRIHVQQAAAVTLREQDLLISPRWQNFAQPLPLLLQAFKDLTDKDLEFWHRAVPYFQRREYPPGTVLYSRGDDPDGFYILEEGILRAEYELEQGGYYESIVAGTTCGELPFFSETDRTGTVVAEKCCVTWLLTKDKWKKLEKDLPEVARELLKIGLKLTSERMNAITSYMLVTAS